MRRGVNLLRAGAVALLLLPAAARGQAPAPVVLNEVLYDPVGADTGLEWVELFHGGSSETPPADLSGWRIERGGATFTSVFTFPPGTTLAPGSFLTVGESGVQEADLVASLALQNGGGATDGVRLVTGAGTVVDVLLYDTPNLNALPDETGSPGTSFAPDVAAGHSLGRIPDGKDTNASAGDFTELKTLAPGLPNLLSTPAPTPTPTPTPTPVDLSGIVVNEILPDPVGSDTTGEFVELKNMKDSAVDLSGALLDDADGGSAPHLFPSGTVLGGGGLRAFFRGETGLALNNEGDRARLLQSDGTLVAELVYGASPREGAAWMRTSEGAAEWTLTPTPGAANNLTALTGSDKETAVSSPEITPVTSPVATPQAVPLSNVRGLPEGTLVRTTGVVSAPPGVFGATTFYLGDSGLLVTVAGKIPPLALGDRVTVEGVWSSTRGEARIRAAASAVRRTGTGPPPEPRVSRTSDVGESVEGSLLRLGGRVVQLAGNVFLLDDGSGPARVLVKRSTGWTRPSLARGQEVIVVGIVSQWEGTYRLLPRFASDLRVGRPPPRARSARAPTHTSEPRSSVEPSPRPTEPGQPPENPPAAPSASSFLPIPTLVSWGAAGVLSALRFLLRRS